MYTVLAADTSESFLSALQNIAGQSFRIETCRDGLSAYRYLCKNKPDAAVINLRLPGIDGLSVLQRIHPNIPPATLVLTPWISNYVERILAELGVNYMLITPTSPDVVLEHINNMLYPQNGCDRILRQHLNKLGIPEKSVGYQHLLVGIPLFAKDRQQRLSKELYPAVAELCGVQNGTLIEHSIRTAIASAWRTADMETWELYFSKCREKQPSNKAFITALANIIQPPFR